MKDGWLELNGEPALSNITLRGMLKEHSPGRDIGRGSTCLTPLPCPSHSPDLPHRTTRSAIYHGTSCCARRSQL
jgi:hypothetical protein